MRTYTIDQLEEADIAAINTRLLDLELQAGLEGVYWLPVPKGMLTPPHSAQVKTEWSYIYTPTYAFVTGTGTTPFSSISK